MNKAIFAAASLAVVLAHPASAQDAPSGAPSPGEIVAQAAPEEWVAIPAEDLLVMTLSPDAKGRERKVVLQLMPAPFSQGWVDNIRLFARSGWYDGISVNRVQDNYVVQWGDPNYDNPEATGETKALPEGLKVMREDEYVVPLDAVHPDSEAIDGDDPSQSENLLSSILALADAPEIRDPYAQSFEFYKGWPIAGDFDNNWPTHCYGMVGVGRNYSPETGSGAELYTVIGHAPRHLDRNIALVGRIISGMEHLSSLPRGSGALGFYSEDEADLRTAILSVRVAADLPENERPAFEYLSTESETFARYADARANRRDPFFIHPAGGADICNIPVPVRPVASE